MFLRPGGKIEIFGVDGLSECDTFTCHHCQKVVKVPAGCSPSDLGGHCRSCDKLICPGCVDAMHRGENCTPWEKQMIAMENREAARRSYGI